MEQTGTGGEKRWYFGVRERFRTCVRSCTVPNQHLSRVPWTAPPWE